MKNLMVALVLSFIFSAPSFGQIKYEIEEDSITKSVLKANIKKNFLVRNSAIENLKETDFQEEFILTEKTNLNIRAFSNNSLTNYPQILAPELTAKELTSKGNFQFTFLIDSKRL